MPDGSDNARCGVERLDASRLRMTPRQATIERLAHPAAVHHRCPVSELGIDLQEFACGFTSPRVRASHQRTKGSKRVASWVRWGLVTSAVVVIFWLSLVLGHWLPLGAPEDDANRWGVATALASAVSAVAVLPLIRWAERSQQPPKDM
ncbi:hypothetical protein EASAB2608_06526 [Streptomyces sp. EAS-AB2608]|nr:hypothetical protein EASAB2608_06526 [Streptomyces sp. EAS-AB2608]